MNNEENVQGNPEAVDNAVLGSEGDDFFSALEDSVNSMVQDNEKPEAKTEATPDNQGSNNVAAEAEVSQDSDLDNIKKRYSDSSREAQSLRAQLNESKPFIPVLDAMKKDSGLVDHVRGYFQEGGAVPKNVKEQLNLGEDFEEREIVVDELTPFDSWILHSLNEAIKKVDSSLTEYKFNDAAYAIYDRYNAYALQDVGLP